MTIEIINLKKDFYRIEKIENNAFIKRSLIRGYAVNNSLIILSSSTENVIAFSFLLAKIFKLSRQDYNRYIKNFSKQSIIPKLLLDLRIITKTNNKVRIPKPKFYFRNLQLNLTPNCNLRCIYCSSWSGRRQERKTMSYQIAKAAVDYVAKFCKGKLNLIFVGEGETTTEFILLKKIFNYAKSIIPEVRINPISTNGVISRTISDWLIKNADKVQISCDGPDFLQNKYRPLINGKGSSKFVERTIKYFVKKNKDFIVNAVITDGTLGNEKKIINYFFNLGVKKLGLSPLMNIGSANPMPLFTKDKNVKISNQSQLYFNSIQQMIELQNEVGMKLGIKNFDKLGHIMTCGIYTKAMFTVDPYGNVSACERYNSPKDFQEYPFMKDFLIGKYNSREKKFEIDFQKLEDLSKNIDEQFYINKCKKCSLLSACPTICLYEIATISKTLNPQYSTCSEVNKNQLITPFSYLAIRYFANKKPCLEFRGNKLFYSLFLNEFELCLSKNGTYLSKNPYILIDQLDKLDLLAKKIISYKNSRADLTIFLLRFELEDAQCNKTYGKKITNFFNKLKINRIYFRVTEPLSKIMFGNHYSAICDTFNLPKSYKECLELYRIEDNKVFFSKNKKGSKKFSEYEDRDAIYKDFRNIMKK